jgi:hypothetical protein
MPPPNDPAPSSQRRSKLKIFAVLVAAVITMLWIVVMAYFVGGAFMMGMTTALLPSFTVVALLFLRSRILLGRTFVLTQQPDEPARMLRIIRGGRTEDDLP